MKRTIPGFTAEHSIGLARYSYPARSYRLTARPAGIPSQAHDLRTHGLQRPKGGCGCGGGIGLKIGCGCHK